MAETEYTYTSETESEAKTLGPVSAVTIAEAKCLCLILGMQLLFLISPLKCSGVRQSHLKVSNAIQSAQALWRSGLSARVPECQKLKMVG